MTTATQSEVLEDDFSSVEDLGIVQLGGADAAGRPVLVFSACRLPRPADIDMDLLARYLTWRIRAVVEADYTIVYLHSGMQPGISLPAAWLYRVWQSLDRAYKKNLKALYVVHPSVWVRVVIALCRPFVSPKFWVKLKNIRTLDDLAQHVRLDQIDIPQPVEEYDEQRRRRGRGTSPGRPQPGSQALGRHPQFGVAIDRVSMDGAVPLVLSQAAAVIRENGLETEGIFRKSAALVQVQTARAMYDNGEAVDLAGMDVHVAASLFKLFLRELPEPIIADWERVLAFESVPEDQRSVELDSILKDMGPRQRAVLDTVVQLVHDVAAHSHVNLMTVENISIVFAPNLMWCTDPDQGSAAAALASIKQQVRFFTSLYGHLKGGTS